MLKLFTKHIKGYEKDAIKSPLFIAIEAICELFLPLLMADIIDVGINGDGGMPFIWKAGLGMLALSVLSLYSGMTAAKSSSIASQGLGRNLRHEMFAKIQDFSFADIDRFSSASLITRLTNDVNTIQMTTMMCLRMLVRAPVQLLSALVVCLTMNARLTLVIAVVIPVMCLLLWLIMRACERLFTRFQQKIDALNDTVQENLIGIRVVKAFVRGDFERKKFKKSNDELRDAGLAAVMRVILISPVMMLSMYAAILGVMWFGGGFVARGELLPGELYAFFSYIVQVLMSVLMVGMCLLMLTRAVACARRVSEVLEAEPDISDSPDCGSRELPESRGRVEFKRRAPRHRPHRRARAVRGHRRRHRHRQINAREPHPPLLRRDGGPGACRRRGRARLPPRGAAQPHRHGAPDQRALLRHGEGKPALGPGRRHG